MIRRSLGVLFACAWFAAGCATGADRDEPIEPTPVGLDLADVVLSPETPLGSEELARAAATIRKRAEAFGLHADYVEARDGAVVLRLTVRGLGPGARDRVAQLGRPATVTFRPVLALAGLPSGATYEGRVPPEAQAAFDALNCEGSHVDPPADAEGTGAPERPDAVVLACDRDGNWKYVLAPVALDGADIRAASAQYTEAAGPGGWQVAFDWTEQGAADYRELTERLRSAGYPTADLAVMWRGVVLSVPNAAQLPEGGTRLSVSGNFTERVAGEFAGVVSAGTLPVVFTVTSYVYTR